MKNTPAGVYTLTVCFTLLLSFLAITCEAQMVPLVSSGAIWKYLDDGSDQGTAWRLPAFNDAAWPSGAAQLGFGDGDETTLVNQTNSLGVTNITFYFRRAFNVSDLSAVSNLLVRLRRDDGAVVYLNGTEVFRSNMPQGPVTAATLALTATSDDGASFFANAVNRSLLVSGVNVLAVEIHQSSVTSSDISFDLELLGNVEFVPPTISIVRPTQNALVGSLHLTVDVSAADVDGTISLVELIQNGSVVASSSSPPFTLVSSNIAAGNYTLTAVAVDSTGLSATSAPVNIRVPPRLISSGSLWKYVDTGVDPGPTWMTPLFNDAAWPSGFAELGFGDGDEATVLSPTNSAGAANITFYFRQSFDVANLASITNLVVRVRRDDGCIVYLNGVEIFRDNMPAGPVTSSTLAVTAIDDSEFHSGRVNAALLVAGRNVVAVEVHQAAITSSDISLDLELLPNIPPIPPALTISWPTNNTRFVEPGTFIITTTTSDIDDRIASVGFVLNGSTIGTDTTEPFSFAVSNLAVGTYALSAVATDEFGNRTTASPVQLRVVPLPIYTSLVATGSVWKYSDTGTDLGTAWREPSFNDSSWLSGAAKLGFSDNPTTTINIGPTGDRFMTAYFRRHFQLANAIDVTNLFFRVLRDDGCVVYLNGIELFRMNMAFGPVTYTNRAITIVGGTNELHYYPLAIDPPFNSLLEGDNVLAVELHQSDPLTSDAGFDLGVTAISPAPGTVVRMSITRVATSIRISWPGTGPVLQEALSPSGPFTDVSPSVTTGPYTIPAPSGNRFFRLRPTQ